jgi:signal peptidase I
MKSALRETIQTVALAVFVFLVFQSTVQNYRVEGSSMNPTLEDRQLVLVNKLVYLNALTERVGRVLPWVNEEDEERWYPFHAPRQGDTIIFQAPIPPFDDFVKRVIGVPGDTVEIRQGVVYVNGDALDESYLAGRYQEGRASVTVGSGEYYVLGDNRARSDDSRNWGMVPEENIIGKAWVGYWPMDKFGFLASAWHR